MRADCVLSFLRMADIIRSSMVSLVMMWWMTTVWAFCPCRQSRALVCWYSSQRPGQPEPDEGGAPGLQVQTMTGGGWVDDSHRDFPLVPVGNVLGGLDFPDGKPGADALQIVLEPVGHQDGLSVGGFDEVLQSVPASGRGAGGAFCSPHTPRRWPSGRACSPEPPSSRRPPFHRPGRAPALSAWCRRLAGSFSERATLTSFITHSGISR